MDFRYYDYLLGDSKYYKPISAKKSQKYTLDFSDSWEENIGEHWISLFPKERDIKDFPAQGWKIHITSTIQEAKECLKVVSKYLFGKKISFKYVKNEFQLIIKNSKNSPREFSGKFITIYPKDIKEFEIVIKELEELLRNFQKGPYILSDRRWKNSNLYYRYGGFVENRLEDGSLAIVDNQGKLVEDLRLPYYNIPEWVVVPNFLQENEVEEDLNTELDNYNILSALHFSNAGGVYEVENKLKERYILKEARPMAGLDGNGKDAVFRLKKEYSAMDKLKKISCVTDVYKIFKAWEHYFLLMEYLDGESLAAWMVRNYPLSNKGESGEYIVKLREIAIKCCEGLKDIHKMGITHGDIQPKNIMIIEKDGDFIIKFIDFETAGVLGERGDKSLGTPGYFDSIDDFSEQKDWTGLLRIFKNALIPVVSLESLAENSYDIHYNWIKENLGDKATDILDTILEYAKDDRYNIKYTSKELVLKESIYYNKLAQTTLSSLKKEIIKTRGMINGDIKQFTYPYGKLSFGYGALGAVLLLNRLEEEIPDYIIKELKYKLTLKELDFGLISGISGIANSFYEIGGIDEAHNIYEKVFKNCELILKTSNISLESGLSGLGLALLDMYIQEKDEKYLTLAVDIYEKIRKIFLDNPEKITTTSGLTSDGLLYGWSGASLYSFSLFNVLKKEEYLLFAKELLFYEIKKIENIDKMSLLKTKDSRLMPYFSVGSVGLVIPLILMRDYIDKDVIEKILSGIKHTLLAKPCVCAGFYEGYLGLLYISKYIDIYHKDLGEKTNLENTVIKNFNQYLLFDKEDRVYFPGNYSLRLSFDIATGLAGLAAYIYDDFKEKFLWLPLISQKELFDLK